VTTRSAPGARETAILIAARSYVCVIASGLRDSCRTVPATEAMITAAAPATSAPPARHALTRPCDALAATRQQDVMTKVEQVTIERPVQDVWDYPIDRRHDAVWTANVVELDRSGAGDPVYIRCGLTAHYREISEIRLADFLAIAEDEDSAVEGTAP
jgi:hypothetical protein